MDRAAEIRNRDVALALLGEAGHTGRSQLIALLARERVQAEAELAALLKRWSRREFSAKWRARLDL